MKFFKFLNFPLKSTEISVGLRFQLASVTINFTDNRDYRAVLYFMLRATNTATTQRRPIRAAPVSTAVSLPTPDAKLRRG